MIPKGISYTERVGRLLTECAMFPTWYETSPRQAAFHNILWEAASQEARKDIDWLGMRGKTSLCNKGKSFLRNFKVLSYFHLPTSCNIWTFLRAPASIIMCIQCLAPCLLLQLVGLMPSLLSSLYDDDFLSQYSTHGAWFFTHCEDTRRSWSKSITKFIHYLTIYFNAYRGKCSLTSQANPL